MRVNAAGTRLFGLGSSVANEMNVAMWVGSGTVAERDRERDTHSGTHTPNTPHTHTRIAHGRVLLWWLRCAGYMAAEGYWALHPMQDAPSDASAVFPLPRGSAYLSKVSISIYLFRPGRASYTAYLAASLAGMRPR